MVYARPAVITEGQQRAICRIYVSATKTRGTGFLIADDAVLTAAHVVRSSGSKNTPASGDIELRFGVGGPVVVHKSWADPAQFDGDLDWAILRLPAGNRVPLATPFRGFPLPAESELGWETFGYSQAAAVAGKAYGGEVLTQPSVLFQVRITSTKDLVAGLSGSPCLVDGHVVGVIVQSEDEKPGDTLFVLPIEKVKGPPPLVLRGEAPYARDAQDHITRFESYLPSVAVKLELAGSELDVQATFGPGRLVKRCAVAMMGGVGPTLEALTVIEGPYRAHWSTNARNNAEELLKLAGRVWIPSEAVNALASALTDNQLVVLNAKHPDVAESYVHRASCLGAPVPGTFSRLLHVSSSALTDQEWLDAFDAEVLAHPLLNSRGHAQAAELLKKHFHAKLPIVALLSGVPPRTAIDSLRARGSGYEKVRLVLLVDSPSPPRIASEYAEAVIIEPAPEPKEMKARAEELEQHLEYLAQVFA